MGQDCGTRRWVLPLGVIVLAPLLVGCSSTREIVAPDLAKAALNACLRVETSAPGVAISGTASVTTATQAAKALKAANLSPHPWDTLPADSIVYACSWPDGKGRTTSEFVDGEGHVSSAIHG